MTAFGPSDRALDDRVALDPLQYATQSRDADVLTMVRRALATGQARLAFQPVVRSNDPRFVAFYEGLIRVLDETGRVIPAHQFMDAVEETDLGRELDGAALGLAFDMLAARAGLRLSVNMSARSIADGAWRDLLLRHLTARPDLGPRLILEISERSAMLLPEVVIRFMEEMQPRGVAFALDDFGAGFTAFRHLRDFFFDMAKIDRCFVRHIDGTPDNQVLVEALSTVTRQFEMFSIAEGVETAEEAAILARIGVDCLQGWHFGVPRFAL